jgi:hypothetical protein
VTLAGTVRGLTSAPLANTRIALIAKANLGTLAIGGSGFRDTVSNTRGEFAFTGVATGSYFVGPYVEGAIFRVTGTQVLAPADLNLTASTGTLGLSFSQAGIDSSNPVLTVSAVDTGARPAITGTLVDPVSGNPKTASGPLGVAASLYRTASGVVTVYNFRLNAFETAKAPVGGTNPLLNPDYYRVAAVSALASIPAGATGLTKGTQFTPAGATFPTEVRSSFSIVLPQLGNGSYRLLMGGVDGSLRRSAIVTREFNVGTTPPASDTVAPTARVATVGGTNISAGDPKTPIGVPALSPITGSASDSGGGVASVRLHIARNLRQEGFSLKGDFWNGTAFVPGVITFGTQIKSLPSVAATITPAAGGTTVVWSYSSTSSLLKAPGSYGLLPVATDKAGNVTAPAALTSLSDLEPLRNAIRTVTISSTPSA